MSRTTTLTAPMREVLTQVTIQDNGIILPKIDAKLYKQVADVLSRVGFNWNRKYQMHIGDREAQLALDTLLYGEKLPDKNPLAFWPTPPDVADLLVQALRIDWSSDPTILEPSAGRGALLEALARNNVKDLPWSFLAIELDPARAAQMREVGSRIKNAWANFGEYDFLGIDTAANDNFDYIAMNPPFAVEGDPQAYMTHIVTAFNLLAPGGRLASIVPTGCIHGSTKRHQDFRQLLDRHDVAYHELPEGAFKGSGTSVNCVLITLEG